MPKVLTLVVITKNAAKSLYTTLSSVSGLVDEIIIIDDFSKDETIKIAKQFSTQIFIHHEYDLGLQRKYGLSKVKTPWVLILDADEILSDKIKKEISLLFSKPTQIAYDGFMIPFQTHFLGKPLHHGGENYSKMALFKMSKVKIKASLIHEKYEITQGEIGTLKNSILHYSYESIIEMYKKFTDYAVRDAKQKKFRQEKSSFKKIFIYPIHMFWARFIIDKGYQDGIFRIPLDLGFAYMEFLTYLLLALFNLNSKLIVKKI